MPWGVQGDPGVVSQVNGFVVADEMVESEAGQALGGKFMGPQGNF